MVLITPPPVDEEAWFRFTQATHGTPDTPEARRARSNATTGVYARAVVTLAESLQLPVVDLHSAMMALPDWKGLLSDGLHFNDKGQVFVYGAVSQVIDIAAPHLIPGPSTTLLPFGSSLVDRLAGQWGSVMSVCRLSEA